jgi:predicted unusual protein kinase regulating ubiquinone biosynthesis (AarF/ABC1/UbiB family)
VTPEMLEKAEQALKIYKHEIQQDGATWPKLFIYHGDKVTMTVFDPGMMNDWREKNKIALMILLELYMRDADICVFVSDAWRGLLPPEIDIETMPKDFGEWPKQYLKEDIMVTVNAMGQVGETIMQNYERVDGKVVFKERITIPHEQSNSRFRFDLTGGRGTIEFFNSVEALKRFGRDGGASSFRRTG